MAFTQLKGLNPDKVQWERVTRIVGATLLCSSLLAVPKHAAQGQSVGATVTEILDSNQVYIQNRTAQVNSVAQQRQQVRTQAARASLRFNNGAVARLAHNSSLVVGQCAQVNRGTLLVNGNLNGCSTSTVAGVRGTIYTIEVTEDDQTIIQVFEGEVVVQHNPHPESAEPVLDERNLSDPTSDPVVPSLDPVVPLVNPGAPGPSEPPVEPPSVEPPPVEPPPTRTPPGPVTTPPRVLSTPKPGLVATVKQDSPTSVEGAEPTGDLTPANSTESGASEEVLEFTPEDSITVAEGQQVTVDAENNQAVLALLTADDFIELLEGPLINGFAVDIPGISDLQRSFEQLFPGIPLPSYWVPPIPSPPISFPFPF